MKKEKDITEATRDENVHRLSQLLDKYPHYIYFEKEPTMGFISKNGYTPMKLHVIFKNPKGNIAFLSEDYTKQYIDLVSDEDLTMLLLYIEERFFAAEKATYMETPIMK